MGFSSALQGRAAHEALLVRQDAELRLLETMKRCMLQKSKCDKEYAIALTAVSQQGLKIDRADELQGSHITKAWKSFMDEIEHTAKQFKTNAEALETLCQDRITQLYQDKRKARKTYQEEHNKIATHFTHLTEEVVRKKSEYQKNLEHYRLLRTRFEDHYVKSGRVGRKLDDVRDKYQKACRKLHLAHNEYVLLITEAVEVEKDFRTILLPGLLEHQQSLQEGFITIWKNLLLDAAQHGDFTSDKFRDIQKRIELNIHNVNPSEEYREFTEKHKTQPAAPTILKFDETLINDSLGKLQPNLLTVDNLTVDWLRNRMTELEASAKEIQEKQNKLLIENSGNSLPSTPVLNGGPNGTTAKEFQKYSKERNALRCQEKQMLKLADMIKTALNEVGCEELPSGCDDLSVDQNYIENGINTDQQESLLSASYFLHKGVELFALVKSPFKRNKTTPSPRKSPLSNRSGRGSSCTRSMSIGSSVNMVELRNVECDNLNNSVVDNNETNVYAEIDGGKFHEHSKEKLTIDDKLSMFSNASNTNEPDESKVISSVYDENSLYDRPRNLIIPISKSIEFQNNIGDDLPPEPPERRRKFRKKKKILKREEKEINKSKQVSTIIRRFKDFKKENANGQDGDKSKFVDEDDDDAIVPSISFLFQDTRNIVPTEKVNSDSDNDMWWNGTHLSYRELLLTDNQLKKDFQNQNQCQNKTVSTEENEGNKGSSKIRKLLTQNIKTTIKFTNRVLKFNKKMENNAINCANCAKPLPLHTSKSMTNLYNEYIGSLGNEKPTVEYCVCDGLMAISTDDIQIKDHIYSEPFLTLSTNRPLYEEEWFHGVLPREEVVRLLKNDGDFLVRETTRNEESQIVLSVCWNGHKHFIVQTTAEGHFRFEGPAFPSIQELIMHQYQSESAVTSRSGAVLRRPVMRERWELSNDDVILIDKIGRGNFGDVYKARLKSSKQEVAVKTCRMTLPDEQKRKFLQEGRILKQYDHPNIVKLIGICVQKQPIMIVMELVPGGSLLNFLRKNTMTLNIRQLMCMCRDAAAGMRYLESKNCIHRDLAARNCLIGYENTVKISDFGMSREEEEYIVSDGMKQIPIKWTAPEALNFGKYTSLCDVWSYGILMWEIFSRGDTPYSGMSNSKARERIDAGYRMPAPENTPVEMYRLMIKCWNYEPEMRPHFDEIYTVVDALINNMNP